MTDKDYKKTGTTTLGIVCKDGVVLAADKRATAGHFIANKRVDKVFPVADNVAITVAGLVSDVQLLSKLLKAELSLKKYQTGRTVSAKEAANLLAGMSYNNIRKFSTIPGIVGFLLAGHDDEKGSSLWEIGTAGDIFEIEDYVSDGSGSVFVYGVLETLYKENMSLEEGVQLAQKAINAAVQRDSASGNGFDVLTITKDGVKKVAAKKISNQIV